MLGAVIVSSSCTPQNGAGVSLAMFPYACLLLWLSDLGKTSWKSSFEKRKLLAVRGVGTVNDTKLNGPAGSTDGSSVFLFSCPMF